MAMHKLQLTIIVPSYNVESYLERGLTSYNQERFQGRLEVIVVDDGSTDATAAIAERFVMERPAIFRLISKENGGHGSAVNAGIAAARGRYLRVVDGDDWVRSDGLDELLSLLETVSTDLVVDWRRDVHMTTGETEPRPLGTYFPLNQPLGFDTVAMTVAKTSLVQIHTLNVRTDFARACQLKLLEHTFYVDMQYVLTVTAYAKTVTFVDIEVYQYLVGNASQSVAAPNFVKRFGDHDRVVKTLLEFVASEPVQAQATPARKRYLDERLRLLINTHMNIMLVYDADRARGHARARDFRRWLKANYPALARRTAPRFAAAWMVGAAGASAATLDKLLGRMRHEA